MTQFTTTIDRMYTLQQPDPDYVVNVLWAVTGVDGDNTASIGGKTLFNTAVLVGPVTPSASLTESIVIGWIPESAITSAQQCVQGQINSLITPPVSPTSQPLPWTA